jgi:transcriptional regulator with XRE-family HTH domain
MTANQEVRHCTRCGARLTRYNDDAMCAPCQAAARAACAKPPQVPLSFWQIDQMRDALATWHMGRVIFAYRMHPYHGRALTQEVVGSWLGLTQAQLSRMEKGRAPEEISKLRRYAQILGIPAELLWFDLPGESRTKTTTEPISLAFPSQRTDTEDQGAHDLVRRLQAYGLSASALPALNGEESRHMAAALDHARRYLDASVVDYFRRQLDSCKADDGALGPRRTLPIVLGILGAIAQRVREVKPDVRYELLSVGADGAEFVGWLYRDLRDQVSAGYWYDRAMEWAQEAGDGGMQGYVLLKKSQMAYDKRDAFRVLTLAEAAGRASNQLPNKVRAEALQSEAMGLAMLHEPLTLIEQKLDVAHSLVTAGIHDPSELGAYFTEDTLLLRSAACYTEAGKPEQAVMLFSQVISGGTLSRRDAGFFRARQAVALALNGEPDDAVTMALESVAVARATDSERTMHVLMEVMHALTPWNKHPGVQSLREAILS